MDCRPNAFGVGVFPSINLEFVIVAKIGKIFE